MRPTVADMELWGPWLRQCWEAGDSVAFADELAAARAIFGHVHGAAGRLGAWAFSGKDPGFKPCGCCVAEA